jgi:hypothetical protein
VRTVGCENLIVTGTTGDVTAHAGPNGGVISARTEVYPIAFAIS